jgi:predicted TPR repeat methyltransferase
MIEQPPPAPAALQAMLLEAIALRRQNDFAGAESRLRAVLAADPRNYDALHLLGMLAYDAGDGTAAVASIAAAIAVDGSQAAAHYNLGNALRLLGREAEAVASYERALALKPDHARAHNNRANALWELKRTTEAVDSYSRAVAIDPGFADAWHNRGNALNELERYDEAIESYRRALDAGGDAARIEYELAALGASAAPATAPARFIVNLFDRYAGNFDRHLVDTLGYATPADTVAAVRRVGTENALDVLDLGCGTGLCGPLLKPFARTLTGVDLSPKMLDKARVRGVYDTLAQADVKQYLSTQTATFDLVIATDLFIYIGDLGAIFAGVARALRSGGLFAFSVERADAGDYVLQRSKRYAQSENYLRRLAGEHGFAVESIDARVIRKDHERDIAGLIAVLRAGQARLRAGVSRARDCAQ